MFVGVIMVCGLVHPAANEGCMHLPSNKLYSTESECREQLANGVDHVSSTRPEGSFVSDAKCFSLNKAT